MLHGMEITTSHHLSAVLENNMPMQQKWNRNFLAPTVYHNLRNFHVKKFMWSIFAFKNFHRILVAYEIFLVSDFFHMCVAACIMVELLSVFEGTTYIKMCGNASYWRMGVVNICSVNISWSLIS